MHLKPLIARLLIPALVGVGAAVAFAPAAEAATGCEKNACFTSDGNCDLSDWATSCVETTGDPGCRTTSCQAN